MSPVAIPAIGADRASAASPVSVRKDGDSLVFAGALLRPVVAALWRQAQPLRSGARRIDLGAVTQVDSAGLAMLAELASGGLVVLGEPVGLNELRAAYRLDNGLAFAA